MTGSQATGQPIVIWGAGGHGRVLADVARRAGYDVTGFVDGDPAKQGMSVGRSGLTVVATEDQLLSDPRWASTLVALGIGDNARRMQCRNLLPDHRLPVLIDPSASVSSSARIGVGTVVLPRAVVNADANIGDAVLVNSAAVVDHDCEIGDAVHLSLGALAGGGARIGAHAWIRPGAVVVPGVEVGEGAVVGPGVVVHQRVDRQDPRPLHAGREALP